MTNILSHAHSGLRWVLLILLVISIVNALTRKDLFEKKDRLIYLFSMVSAHIQLVLGISLYFLSSKVHFMEGWMKTALYRFYGMEHLIGMLLAIVLITIGHIKYKKKKENSAKHKTVMVYYAIGLLVIVLFIRIDS